MRHKGLGSSSSGAHRRCAFDVILNIIFHLRSAADFSHISDGPTSFSTAAKPAAYCPSSDPIAEQHRCCLCSGRPIISPSIPV